jgi:hypothetical protein
MVLGIYFQLLPATQLYNVRTILCSVMRAEGRLKLEVPEGNITSQNSSPSTSNKTLREFRLGTAKLRGCRFTGTYQKTSKLRLDNIAVELAALLGDWERVREGGWGTMRLSLCP